MSTLAAHYQKSTQLFGDLYEAVHRWLGEFQGTERYRMRHRRVRYHEAGIREAVKLFGGQAEAVARQHIISNLKEEGWTERDPFPQNEAHYVKMEYF